MEKHTKMHAYGYLGKIMLYQGGCTDKKKLNNNVLFTCLVAYQACCYCDTERNKYYIATQAEFVMRFLKRKYELHFRRREI